MPSTLSGVESALEWQCPPHRRTTANKVPTPPTSSPVPCVLHTGLRHWARPYLACTARRRPIDNDPDASHFCYQPAKLVPRALSLAAPRRLLAKWGAKGAPPAAPVRTATPSASAACAAPGCAPPAGRTAKQTAAACPPAAPAARCQWSRATGRAAGAAALRGRITVFITCVPDKEEEEHGCAPCEACVKPPCPAADACLSCAAAAEQAKQAPLCAADVRVARDALAAATSDSLRALLQGWLEQHAGAAGAAGKKRKA